jgi:tetratricopeptide (TPR) repeat protein
MRLIPLGLVLLLGGCGATEMTGPVTAGGRTAITAEQVATTLIGQNRCRDAIDTLTTAMAETAANARLLTLRGFCAYVLHDNAAAMIDLNRAVDMDTTYFYPLVVRGQMEADAGQEDAATDDLNRAIALAGHGGAERMRLENGATVTVGTSSDTRAERAWALTLRAELAKRQGDLDPALQDVQAALRLSPSYADAWIVKASTLRAKDDYAAALDADSRALSLEQSARVYREICFDQVALNRPADAARSCNAGLTLEPNAPALLEARAVANLKLSRFDQAEADLNTALAERPNWATLLYARAISRTHLGRPNEALHDLEAARKIVPDIDQIFSRWGGTF